MKHISNKLILSIIFFVLVGMYRTSGAELKRISLEVFASQAEVAAYPIEIGIPFPPKVVREVSNIRLVSAEGKEVACQVEELSRYLDGSLRAVLLVFLSPIYKDKSLLYTVEFGDGVRRKVMPEALVDVREKEGKVIVDSGVLRFQVGRGKGLFREVKIDGKEVCDRVEQFIQGIGEKELVFGSEGDVVIEERGPVRGVVVIRGKFGSDGDGPEYKVRIHAYGGSKLMRIQQTIVGLSNKPFELAGWGLQIPVGVKKGECGVDGKACEVKLSGSGGIFQDGEFRWTWGSLSVEERANRLAKRLPLKGDEAPGWQYRLQCSLNGGEKVSGKADGWMLCEVVGGGGIGVCVRDFWQQYPKEFAMGKDNVTIWLHSPRGAPFIGKAGTAKTHEVLFNFGPVQVEQTKALNGVYQDWPHARVSPEWVCSSGVFGPLLPRSDPFTAGYNTLADLFIEFIKQTAETVVNRACWYKYGNGDFGDFYTTISWNVPHGISREFIIEFLRGGDREWGRLGARASRHYSDIDVCHAKTSESEIGCSWDSGTRQYGYNYRRVPGVWAGSTHGFMGEVLLAKGDKKAELEAKIKVIEEDFVSSASPRDVHQCVPGPRRGGVDWCFHTGGAMSYFFLSGDRRAKEVLVEQAEWILRIKNANATVRSLPSILLTSLLDAHEATGKAEYLHGAASVISNIVFNSKGYRKHGEDGIILSSRLAVSLYRFMELNTDLVHTGMKNEEIKQKFAVATAESMVSRPQTGCTPSYISAWAIAWDTGFWSEETRSIFEKKVLPIISFDRKEKPPPVLRYKIPFLQYKWNNVKKTGEFVFFDPVKVAQEGYLFNRHFYNFTCDYAERGIMYTMPGYPHFVAIWKKYHEKYLKPRMDAEGVLEFAVNPE